MNYTVVQNIYYDSVQDTNLLKDYVSFFFFFLIFRATPLAYGSSQAGVKSELQLLAYTTATAIQDPNCACDLHHSSQ